MSAPGPARSCAAPGAVEVPLRQESSIRALVLGRVADYVELTKPKIAVLALVTVTVGFALASRGDLRMLPLAHALFGIALVAAGSSALNQLFERKTDALMPRTARRPLPDGRLLPAEALVFGLATGGLGCLYLALAVNALTAALAAATLLLYAAVYTPLKRATSLCTAVGAVPGALPPVLGWTAAAGELSFGAFNLFAILFLWQFPHFLAIGWLYREQYARAGLRMLPAARPQPRAGAENASRLAGPPAGSPEFLPRVTGLQCVAYALVLLPVSLLPSEFGMAGGAYFAAAVVLGLGYLACAVRFLVNESAAAARGLLWSSLVYLPLLLVALTWNHFQLLR